MFNHYHDYYWKEGKPYGGQKANPSQAPFSYKIIVDPYYKRFSIEKYQYLHFEKVIYDSCLLDFRHLTVEDQIAWQREVLQERKDVSVCLLRNQEDRAILIETLTFEKGHCRSCTISSAHGIPLSHHHMYYRNLNDSFDGVVLYDIEKHPVMLKVYETDFLTGEFTNLLIEEWNMQTLPFFLQTQL